MEANYIMSFFDLIVSRYSVRKFSDKEIEQEKLQRILQAAMVAPTAHNSQPQKIYVLKSNDAIKKINSVCKSVFGAKTVLLICADENLEWKNPFTGEYHTGEIDCSIVGTHIMLQAWELGIGSCWVGYFDPNIVKMTFGIPENEKLIAIMPLGYPAEDSKPSQLHSAYRAMEDMVKYL
jgi:nitroreductase